MDTYPASLAQLLLDHKGRDRCIKDNGRIRTEQVTVSAKVAVSAMKAPVGLLHGFGLGEPLFYLTKIEGKVGDVLLVAPSPWPFSEIGRIQFRKRDRFTAFDEIFSRQISGHGNGTVADAS